MVGPRETEVALDFLEDIDQRRRHVHAGRTEKHRPCAWPGPWYGS